MSASQPTVDPDSMVDPDPAPAPMRKADTWPQTGIKTKINMTQEERDVKIAELERDLVKLLKFQEFLLGNDKNLKGKSLHIYYFIGRLNPPHVGHIETLIELIERAKTDNPTKSNYKIIILLGSGPKNGNLLDNPLSFQTKKDFITYKLKELFPDIPPNFIFDENIEILEMASAPSQISQITLPLITDVIEEIQMLRVSGTKDGDDSKLNFIEKSIRKILIKYDDILTTDVLGIEAVINENEAAMSATEVRLSILNDYIDGNNRFENYKSFYGDYSQRIQEEITAVATNAGQENVLKYIAKKTHTEPDAGGSRKRKRRQTKRKSRKRKRRQTKRRKSKRRRNR